MKLSIKFFHGLGDCSNFTHMLPLFIKRGFEVEIECSHDKRPVFLASGATIVDKAKHDHPWPHPHCTPFTRLDDNWNGNKTGFNLNGHPLPYIGHDYDRWQDLCDVRLSLEDQVKQENRDLVQSIIKDLPRPIILMHTKGNCSTEGKNLDDRITCRTYELLLNNTDGTIILLDWDNRVSWLHTSRIKRLKIDLPHLDLINMYELMQNSDLLIGIDSGPLHFSRFTNIPALGVWTRHYPSHFVLPIETAVHLIPRNHENGDKYRRLFFNTIMAEGDLTADEIAKHALRILSPAKYIKNPKHKMRDVQLQNFVDRNGQKNKFNTRFWDRNISFDKALRRLSDIKNPSIVETGCIRKEEDWCWNEGAGFSTYIFSHFAHYNDGKLNSVDCDSTNCQFAKIWTNYFGKTCTVHQSYSKDFLEKFQGGIDLFYADSADTDTDRFQEICLEEVQLAQRNLNTNSMILIDDTYEEKGVLVGKGKLAVPWLLENDWIRIYNGYQQLLARKSL